ncbi:hypothetical protein SAMN04489726_6176 [Allokutzneria albata]|uniref:Uncharacterized protein n=1 Tax=Allokutzneria albata TaxID=211114 RepID=A0A1H0AMZ2_ALLAB|nr:hypothetical protein SAMN04489726_6176 [Allokutzneria albata]
MLPLGGGPEVGVAEPDTDGLGGGCSVEDVGDGEGFAASAPWLAAARTAGSSPPPATALTPQTPARRTPTPTAIATTRRRQYTDSGRGPTGCNTA